MSGLILTASIKNITPHPDAKKLKICTVFDGHEDLQIVCGAANAKAGMTTVLAKVGASLPGGMKIDKATLRGVDSFGMLCSAKELGLTDEGGIIDLPPGTPIGVDYKELSIDLLSSIPWHSFEEKEAFWQKNSGKEILITRNGEKPNTSDVKLLSKTYWKDDQYLYRHFN